MQHIPLRRSQHNLLQVPYVSILNLAADRPIQPELLFHAATATNVRALLSPWVRRRADVPDELKTAIADALLRLCPRGATATPGHSHPFRAADIVLGLLERHKSQCF